MKRSSFRPLQVTVGLLAVLSMAPTAGDVGGCGTEATELHSMAFALARKDTDCERCRECGIENGRCQRACDPTKPVETSIPAACRPLQHDGEVCIRALRSASCNAYRTYVDEVAPSIPSECEFCRIEPEGSRTPGFAAPDGVP